jgi:hypothetical protein
VASPILKPSLNCKKLDNDPIEYKPNFKDIQKEFVESNARKFRM